jgi:flagellar assembly protein FliH
MPLSKIIKAGGQGQEKVKPYDLFDLTKPIPEPQVRMDVFAPASYYRAQSRSNEDSFEPAFVSKPKKEEPGPEEENQPKEEPAQEEPPPPDPEEVRARIEAEGKEIRRQAREEGRKEGLAAGREAAETEKANAVKRMLGAAEAMEGFRERMMADLEGELVELVLAAASKVVAAEVETNPQVALNLVKAGLKHVSQSRWARIRVNPDDLELIEEHRPKILEENLDLTKVDLTPDSSVARGGCLITTEAEEIDNSLETRLAGLNLTLERVLREHP